MSVNERLGGLQLTEINHPDIKRILVLPDREMAANEAAGMIVGTVGDNPVAVISYATGETMIPVYAAVSRMTMERGVSFTTTTAFHLDEYYPADPRRDDFSFVRYLRDRVFGPFGIATAFELDGMATDPVAEASRYDQLLQGYTVDLEILGVGPGGHVGFNERGTLFNQRTAYVELGEETIRRDRIERNQGTPAYALTQGIANILEARQILLVAYGERKGKWLREALCGPIDSVCPASALRLVGDRVTMVIDQEAAEVLQQGRE